MVTWSQWAPMIANEPHKSPTTQPHAKKSLDTSRETQVQTLNPHSTKLVTQQTHSDSQRGERCPYRRQKCCLIRNFKFIPSKCTRTCIVLLSIYRHQISNSDVGGWLGFGSTVWERVFMREWPILVVEEVEEEKMFHFILSCVHCVLIKD